MIAGKAQSVRSPGEKAFNQPPWWKPMIWAGCDFFAWIRLLARNRFQVHWSCLHVADLCDLCEHFSTQCFAGCSGSFTAGGWPARRFASAIFIIGHWRTGTTLLHELLALDERHAFPTTYECMEPNHFLLSEDLFTRWLPFIAPTRRPDGQHGCRLQPSAGRRIRPVHVGTSIPLFDDRISESSAAVRGISRSGRSVAAGAGFLEASVPAVLEGADLQAQKAADPQVAHA